MPPRWYRSTTRGAIPKMSCSSTSPCGPGRFSSFASTFRTQDRWQTASPTFERMSTFARDIAGRRWIASRCCLARRSKVQPPCQSGAGKTHKDAPVVGGDQTHAHKQHAKLHGVRTARHSMRRRKQIRHCKRNDKAADADVSAYSVTRTPEPRVEYARPGWASMHTAVAVAGKKAGAAAAVCCR